MDNINKTYYVKRILHLFYNYNLVCGCLFNDPCDLEELLR